MTRGSGSRATVLLLDSAYASAGARISAATVYRQAGAAAALGYGYTPRTPDGLAAYYTQRERRVREAEVRGGR